MAKIQNIRIEAIYASVPKSVVRTADYPHFTEEESDSFSKNTGVKERRVANAQTTCSDLCLNAAEKLLHDFKLHDEIDLLIFVSQSPDYFLPSTAAILQDKLGLKTSCQAFDVNLGCSGYVYGLNIAGQFLQSRMANRVLLLVGDKSTISTCELDKSTFPLFGDAGTATLLCWDAQQLPWVMDAGTDGKGAEAIIIKGGHSRHPYGTYDDAILDFQGNKHSNSHLHLEGLSVFNFALKEVPKTINSVLEEAKMNEDDIDFYVLHQANDLITKTIAKKLNVDYSKFLSSIEFFGNTSSASIPLTLVHNAQSLPKNKLFNFVLCGFGVGFSWATLLIPMKMPLTKYLEYESV